MRMLKKNLSVIAAAFVVSASSLFGLVHPDYEQCERWGVAGEYLFWRPDVDDTQFVVVTNSTATAFVNGQIKGNDFGFHSGFRVEGAYSLGCTSDLHFRYARLVCDSSQTYDSPNGTDLLWPTQGALNQVPPFLVGSANSSIDFRFQNAELLYSNRIWNSNSCSRFYVFGGLQYFDFKFGEQFTYTSGDIIDIVSRKFRGYGIGPELGVEFDIPLNFCWCGWDRLNLAVVGQASGSLLAQSQHLRYTVIPIGFAIEDVHTNATWRVVPAFNIRGGLRYASTCWCLNFDLEVGYEFNSYLRSLTRLGNDVGFAFYFLNNDNLNMQGLYASLGLTF